MKFNVISSKMTFLYTWFFGISLSFTPKGPFRGAIVDIKFARWLWSIALSIPPKKSKKNKDIFKGLDFDYEEYIDDEED